LLPESSLAQTTFVPPRRAESQLPLGGTSDIIVNAGISWASANSLTLSAYHDVTVNASIANTGGGSVTLPADNSGTGHGTVNFGEGGNVSTSGQVAIFYNPAGNNNTTVNATSYTSPTDYSGNVTAGTLNAYMLVNTAFDLQNVRNNLGGAYALGRNIDASATAHWNDGAGFAPITSQDGFNGTLLGRGFTIDGLTIKSSASSLGLFNLIGQNGLVRDLNFTNVNITATGVWANRRCAGSHELRPRGRCQRFWHPERPGRWHLFGRPRRLQRRLNPRIRCHGGCERRQWRWRLELFGRPRWLQRHVDRRDNIAGQNRRFLVVGKFDR
jgi:hypothetical protein